MFFIFIKYTQIFFVFAKNKIIIVAWKSISQRHMSKWEKKSTID